jgi:hypothetical protein
MYEGRRCAIAGMPTLNSTRRMKPLGFTLEELKDLLSIETLKKY